MTDEERPNEGEQFILRSQEEREAWDGRERAFRHADPQRAIETHEAAEAKRRRREWWRRFEARWLPRLVALMTAVLLALAVTNALGDDEPSRPPDPARVEQQAPPLPGDR